MFKRLGLFFVILAVSALAYGQSDGNNTDDGNSTSVATLPQDNGTGSGGLMSGVLSLPYSVISTLMSPVTVPIGYIISAAFSFASSILGTVSTAITLPFRMAGSILSRVFGNLLSVFTLLGANGAGILGTIVPGQTAGGK